MRKTILLSLALAGGAICTPSAAQTLSTPADSVSYVAGYAVTNGLERYLKEQFGVDESQMADVLRGFKEAYAKRNDKSCGWPAGRYDARQADVSAHERRL